jgi:hypothetical protein
MRRPLPEVGSVIVQALRTGAPERLGLMHALPDLPRAVVRRRQIPPVVRADLRRLAGKTR